MISPRVCQVVKGWRGRYMEPHTTRSCSHGSIRRFTQDWSNDVSAVSWISMGIVVCCFAWCNCPFVQIISRNSIPDNMDRHKTISALWFIGDLRTFSVDSNHWVLIIPVFMLFLELPVFSSGKQNKTISYGIVIIICSAPLCLGSLYLTMYVGVYKSSIEVRSPTETRTTN